MKTELSFKEWKAAFLRRIREAGIEPDLDEEMLELMHMESQEDGKSPEERAEENIPHSKREQR